MKRRPFVVDKPAQKPVVAPALKAKAAKLVTAAPAAAKPVAAKPALATAKVVAVSANPVAEKPAPVVAKTITSPKFETPAVPATTAAVQVPVNEGNKLMNDTINKAQEAAKNFAEQTSERTQAMFGDMNVRAKDAMAKGTKAIEELVEFSKGNMEALVASGKVAATGAQDIAKYTADYGRKSIEEATATAKKFAGVKSPTEFFQLQSEVAKSSLDAMVAEGSKFTESYLKLLGEIAQPIQNRVSVAVEKVKTTVAA
jgi:phasin family protein